MFNIDFKHYGATDIRRDETELDLDTPLNDLFEFLTEDMLLVHFKNFDLDISCYYYCDAWEDKPNYSIETFKKIIFIGNVFNQLHYNQDSEKSEICITFVCHYLPELKEEILNALDFINKYPNKNTKGLFNIDFSPGYIIINRPQINLDISYEYLIYLVRDENILKVEFPENIFLEAGWISLDENMAFFYDKNNWTDEFFTKGYFWIKVIKDNNLESSTYNLKCQTLKELKNGLLDAITFIKKNF